MQRSARTLAAASGAAVGVLSWALVVPWDLSEVDALGRPRAGLDDRWTTVVLAGLVVVLGGAALALGRRTARFARPVITGGLGVWAVMFLWRSFAARTDGANMALVPFLLLILPAAAIARAAVGRLADRRRSAKGAR